MLLTFPTKESMLRKLNESLHENSYLIISNYKSLADWNLIPLKALSILLGPNSAGKSTVQEVVKILQLFDRHFASSEVFDILDLWYDAERKDKTRPTIGFSTPFTFNDYFLKHLVKNGLERRDEQGLDFGAFPVLSSLLDSQIVRAKASNTNYTLLIDSLGCETFNLDLYLDSKQAAVWDCVYVPKNEVRINRNVVEWLHPSSLKSIEFEDEDLNMSFTYRSDQYPRIWPQMGSVADYLYDDADDEIAVESAERKFGFISGLFHLPMAHFLSKIAGATSPDIRGLTSDWTFCKTPAVVSSFDQKQFPRSDHVKASVNNHPHSLFYSEIHRFLYDGNYGDSQLFQLNRWLKEPAFLDTKYQLKIDIKACIPTTELHQEFSLKKYISDIHESMMAGSQLTGSSSVEFLARAYLVDFAGRQLDFNQVGTGFSQVIPILSSLATDDTLFYKQPEVHLHPKLQSRLADCYVETVNRARPHSNSRVRFVETHSEHFVMRLLRRLRDSYRDELLHTSLTVYPQDLGLIYFLVVDDKTEIYEIRVSESGGFIDRWPDGFFDDLDEDLI
jgi:predicted ATPase